MADLEFVFGGAVIQKELHREELAALLDVMADRYAKGLGFFLSIPVTAADRANENLEQYWLSPSTQIRGLFAYNEISAADPTRVTELLTALDIHPELIIDNDTGRLVGRADVLGDPI